MVELGAVRGSCVLYFFNLPKQNYVCAKIIYMYLKEFEGTFSPLKVSLRRTGCLYWSRHAWHHVSNAKSRVHFGAVFSLDGLNSDLWLFYGNTKITITFLTVFFHVRT